MLRVLLIDDNTDDRLLAIRELRQVIPDPQIQEVAAPEDFFQALAANAFDLVITDYQLHWSNGIELLHTIKAQYPHCPVIMFTNSGSQEVAVEAMKAGLDDYVLKTPRHYIRLRAAVHGVLERAKERRQSVQLEMRLQSLLQRLEVGVFRATLDGHLLEGNAAFLSLLGVSTLAEAQPLYLRECWTVPSRLPHEPIPVQEVQLHRADGAIAWTRWNRVVVTGDDTPFIDGLVEDITQHKHAEIARVRIAELTHLNQLKDDFLNMVSHDLRAPMTNIKFAIQMLKDAFLPTHNGHRSSDKAAHYLQILQNECDREINLINDILELQRLESDRHTPTYETIDLEHWVSQVIKPFEERAAGRQQQLHVSIEPSQAPILADLSALTRIVSELLNNACKYTPPQETINVVMHLEPCCDEFSYGISRHAPGSWSRASKQRLKLTVCNSGVEIPPKQLPLIFEKFHRVPGSDRWKQGGTGLGLPLVKKLIEQLEGSIEVNSHPGQTCFAVKLPVQLHRPSQPRA